MAFYVENFDDKATAEENKRHYHNYCEWCWGHGYGNCDWCKKECNGYIRRKRIKELTAKYKGELR